MERDLVRYASYRYVCSVFHPYRYVYKKTLQFLCCVYILMVGCAFEEYVFSMVAVCCTVRPYDVY